MVNGEWAKPRHASLLIPSNVSIAEPLFHHNGSMGRFVDRVNIFSTFALEEQPILPTPYIYTIHIQIGYPAGVIVIMNHSTNRLHRWCKNREQIEW